MTDGGPPQSYGPPPRYGPPPGYGQQPGFRPPVGWGPGPGYGPPGGTNTMAVLAIVFAFVFAPLAIVFGVLGRRQIRSTGEEGRSLATAGLVVGIVFTALGLILLAAYIVVFAVFVGHVHDVPDLLGPSANGVGA